MNFDGVSRKQRGLLAEQYVARRLELHPDWVCLCQNYVCVGSEIDLIAHQLSQDTLVFFEVKYRRKWSGVHLPQTVPASKCRALERGARHFLSSCGLDPMPRSQRFDLVMVGGVQTSFEIVGYIAGFY